MLKRGATGDQITINNFYGFSYYGAPPLVEQFRFTDTTLDANSAMSRAITYGTTGADSVYAYYTPTGHTMFMGDGNDSITGSQFVDIVNGEAGDDYVQAYAGNDTLDGGLGNDNLYGNDGNDTLRGGDGADTINAGAGNDTVTGGTGADTISDEGGTDTYLFSKGWGADVLTEYGNGSGDLADVIQFTDVASTEVTFERRGEALVLKRGATGDQITINNFYGFSYYGAPPLVEQFRFTDTTLDANSAMSRAITYGTTGADSVYAYYTPTGHTMFMGDGNDSITGSQFVDIVNGEAGDDYVQAYAGNDTLDGGLGNDNLYGNDGNDTLRGGDGADTINAGAGNDTVTGGTGADTISDEGGTDTYLFSKGWGADVLTEYGNGSGDLADVIQFTDVASTEVTFERRGEALVLKRGATGDQITINNFYGFSYYGAPPLVEQFRFTDTTLDANSAMSRAITYGTTGADSVYAYYTPTGHTMFMGDGNDSITGSQFVDIVNGEAATTTSKPTPATTRSTAASARQPVRQ